VRRAYRALLRLYPYDFRAAFAAQMLAAFASVGAERRGAELAGLLTGVAAECIAKLTSDRSVRGRTLPDIRMIRPAGIPRELWFRGIECSSDTSR
jgi:hypothetical protein